MANKNKCPITIVTGFLGSGKTTLLSNVLKNEQFKNSAVIINEYGEAGLDHRLIRRIEERTVLLSGGCVCCNRREDLIQELQDMLNAYQAGKIPLNRVFIETTGLADPAPILFSILTHPLLVHHYYVDMVITCLDSANGEMQLNNNPESLKQIVVADRVVITKTDLSNTATVENLQRQVLQLNPAALVTTATHGKAGEDFFNPNFIPPTNNQQQKLKRLQKLKAKSKTATHTTNIRSVSIQFIKPLDWLAFGIWMSLLLQKHGERMFRIKGIVDVGEQGPILLNGVQHIIHPPQHLIDWKDYEERNSQIVFIMRDIEPQQLLESLRSFQNLIGAEPEITELNLNPFA